MTKCSECLNALSSARVSDIAPGSAIALHCATCPQCARVADEVRYSEYRLASSLNEARPGRPSDEVAIAAIDVSELRRRRYVARWVRGGLALAAMGIFAAVMEMRVDGAGKGNTVTETMALRCLTGKQAAELLTPYLRSNGSIVYGSEDMRTITIRGTSEELASATMVLDKFDRTATCQATTGAPVPVPSTSDAKQGKD